MTRIVIVGGGFGGVNTALELANIKGIDILLLSKSPNFEYHAALYRSATGRSPREVVIPLRDIFSHVNNLEFIQSEVTSINLQKKEVVSETNQQYIYDKLVMAVGQEINYFDIVGLEQSSYSLDTITNTISLREHLRQVVTDKTKDKPHFAVVGAGASGVELAAELNTFAHRIAAMNKLEPKDFEVSLIEASDRVLPALRPKISSYAKKQLEKLNVEVKLGEKVMSADNNSITLESGKMSVDTIIWTAGNRNNHLYRSHDHIFDLSKNTRVIVDQYLQAKPDVYVIGDSADTVYSGMAQTALSDAEYVAKDILNQHNSLNRTSYEPRAPLYVIPVGKSYAVFQSKHFSLHGYPAWILRRAMDLRLFAAFEPLRKAVSTWRKGNQKAVEY